jgi:flavin-binding protein dodecin
MLVTIENKIGGAMADAVYKLVEIVGTSKLSIDDAIKQGIARASKSLKHLDWFEVIQVRGYLENQALSYYQVMMKVGFRIED